MPQPINLSDFIIALCQGLESINELSKKSDRFCCQHHARLSFLVLAMALQEEGEPFENLLCELREIHEIQQETGAKLATFSLPTFATIH